MYSIREYTKTATCRTAVQHGGLLDNRNPGCILYVSLPRLPHAGQFAVWWAAGYQESGMYSIREYT